MDDQRLERQIGFIVEIDKLKAVLRRSYLVGADRRENSAEHSWHLAVMALLLAEHADQPVDVARVVKMVLIHDIVEIDAGDTYVYDPVRGGDQADRERRAAERLFGLLPDDQAGELLRLWREFEAGESAEARFGQALDRLMPVLHNVLTAGRSWREHGITADRVIARNRSIGRGSGALWRYALERIEGAVARGELAPSPRSGGE